MAKLPEGCRARYEAMHQIADELLDNFHNGNKNDTRDRLKEYDTVQALGIFSAMLKGADKETRDDLMRYFVEAA